MKKKTRKPRTTHLSNSTNRYNFTITEDRIIIYLNITNDFWLSHFELLEMIDVRKLTNCSSYFIELNECEKDGIDSSFFFELAKEIDSSALNHQINWLNTFTAIEEDNYVKHMINRQDDGELDEDDVNVHLTAPKKDGKRFPRKKESNLIREQVILKLKHNNLIK